CCRTVFSLRLSHLASQTLTALSAQERANTIPRLHKASTTAWGLLNMGRWVWMIAVHSSTRVWQDMVVLLVSLGLVETPRMFQRGLAGHPFYTHYPKTLPLKEKGGGSRTPSSASGDRRRTTPFKA